ncbi:uncharacterized protein LOC128635427 isoform X1 [Ictalurus punctatus]|uniref:Uncharacterized protein LOC128635427 isoform X1 n=1 Tax=Ictalurus punctatus TaxID=7998 RepID=A0A9F7TP33_ICTPU|nr:uncharacterized protein LOC128635427 isoform X1 [Ictalurus punctatus]XP_053544394.1 uncharacterized protein LOC128635427 isoform X1 [Ictalurus punctatus]
MQSFFLFFSSQECYLSCKTLPTASPCLHGFPKQYTFPFSWFVGFWMFLPLFSGLSERKKMQDVFGILLMFTGAASGLLFQDPVVCRFNESSLCYVALGQRLHLQIPLEYRFELKITDKTSTTRSILRYIKTQSDPPKPNDPRWQFDKDKTIILTSAERSDSGTYTLDTFDANGNNKGSYTLQLYIEAKVSSVSIQYNCLFPEVRKVHCSADGDNLQFSWTSESTIRLENENSTLVLDKNNDGNVTCHVENHVSRDNNSIELQSCPNFTLIILSLVCVLLIVLSVLAFYIYKRLGLWKKGQKDPSQDGKELVYADITHLPTNKTETRPTTSQAQDKDMEYATVVTHPSQRNQKKNEEEVQYGKLVFNTPDQKKSVMPKVQEECVYSQVQHGQ